MPDTAKLVIGVAGRIGSGKTLVAHYLADRCGFQYLRYSLVLADWFRADPEAKGHLQTVGWGVMSGEGQRELNRRLIAQVDASRDCAIDGLRHPIDYDSLKDAFGPRFFLIYIDTPAEVRYKRRRNQYDTWKAFLDADSHPVESNIAQIVPLASVTLSGTSPLENICTQVEKLVSAFRTREDM